MVTKREITVYETEDGKQFEYRNEAVEHESNEKFRSWAYDCFGTGMYSTEEIVFHITRAWNLTERGLSLEDLGKYWKER